MAKELSPVEPHKYLADEKSWSECSRCDKPWVIDHLCRAHYTEKQIEKRQLENIEREKKQPVSQMRGACKR